MESVLAQLRDAHAEVMRATGWGDALSQVGAVAGRLRESGGVGGMARDAYEDLSLELRLFVGAVDWRGEPFFRYLLAFHALVLLAVLYHTVFPHTRPSETRLVAVGAALLVLAALAYPLNWLGIRHGGRLFRGAGLNYFEESGIFVMAVYFAPLALWCVLVQLYVFAKVCLLMRDIASVRAAREKRRRAAAQDAGAATTADTEATNSDKKND